eukprot:5752843-Amphidinium_carterae.1
MMDDLLANVGGTECSRVPAIRHEERCVLFSIIAVHISCMTRTGAIPHILNITGFVLLAQRNSSVETCS